MSPKHVFWFILRMFCLVLYFNFCLPFNLLLADQKIKLESLLYFQELTFVSWRGTRTVYCMLVRNALLLLLIFCDMQSTNKNDKTYKTKRAPHTQKQQTEKQITEKTAALQRWSIWKSVLKIFQKFLEIILLRI